jgi:hypothetical protein
MGQPSFAASNAIIYVTYGFFLCVNSISNLHTPSAFVYRFEAEGQRERDEQEEKEEEIHLLEANMNGYAASWARALPGE